MENFKEILKDCIQDENISLRKLALKTGIAASQFSDYLRGTIPTLPIAIKITKYFNCSLDYLFGISEIKTTCPLKDSYDINLFFNRYEKALKENNTTHWKLCKSLKLSESVLRHWKNGDLPSLKYLAIIAKELSTSIDYLVGRC